VKSILSEN